MKIAAFSVRPDEKQYFDTFANVYKVELQINRSGFTADDIESVKGCEAMSVCDGMCDLSAPVLEKLAAEGVKELILVAQETTVYGIDLYKKKMLPELLHRLCAIPGIVWIRLLYCYPEEITPELVQVMKEEKKICHYLDIPIQHCDGEILRRMYRPGNETMLRNLIAKIREKMPDVTLRTTLITGFPGETKEQFNALGDFVQDMQFDRLGCFAYSEEEGTDAAEYEDQIDEETREHRAEILMQQQAELHAEKNAAKIGTQMEAVIEGFDPWAGCYFGRTRADAPEIDGKIFIRRTKEHQCGDYVQVEVFDTMDYDLLAEEVEEA